MSEFTRTCPRCNRTKIYTSPASMIRLSITPNCVDCKNIPDESLSFFKEKGIYARKCPTCKIFLEYDCKKSLLQAKDKRCVNCRGIPDETLYLFIEAGMYVRRCPECKELKQYKAKSILLYAIRHNGPCKGCMNSEHNKRRTDRLREPWIPIIGNSKFTYRKMSHVRRYWRRADEIERQRILNLTPLQKTYFWGHLKRRNWVLNRKHLKESFEKYKGDNHWIRRPGVYLKILNSCEKYKGDGHWFRRNKVDIV